MGIDSEAVSFRKTLAFAKDIEDDACRLTQCEMAVLGNRPGKDHANNGLPVLLAGASGQLQGGRHLRYPPQTPMANLLLAMLHKLGAEVESIGDSTEPLAI